MKNSYLKLYGIDVEYEIRTYKNVGKDFDDRKNANWGLLLNIMRYFRKWKNRNQDKYAFCNTYTEWKNHVYTIINKEIMNKNDLIHCLYKDRNFVKFNIEIVKIILIPLYFIMITIFDNIINMQYSFALKWFGEMAIIMFVAAVSMVSLNEAIMQINFYEDFTKVVEEILDIK